jgi:hypothetical protein
LLGAVVCDESAGRVVATVDLLRGDTGGDQQLARA